MCFDAKTSIITFIIGTFFNIFGVYYFNDSVYTATALVWQFVLLMQIFDAMAWTNKCGTFWNKFALNGAYFANMFQPVAVFMAFIFISTVNNKLKIISTILILLYIFWVFYTYKNLEPKNCLSKANNCDHLDYYWWYSPNYWSNPKFFIYFITLSCVIFSLIRPINLFLILSYSYICLTLLVSAFIYKCGAGSVWCFFAAFAPILNFFTYKYIIKK
jgi:hypothetical protein